ncbi:MAG: NAD-dependent epimerase/dehydratase family protein [Candidatus Bathyarchaeia archaeon]
MAVDGFFITGGAGFIGSHLARELAKWNQPITVFDNLSSGSLENLKECFNLENFRFVKGDLLNFSDVLPAVKGHGVIFHLAANPEIRTGSISPEIHFKQNIVATYNLLEAVRKTGGIKLFAFASSSTVYGDASKKPTPEDYSPLMPISVYGASKVACEALIMAYAHNCGFRAVIYRLANIVGPDSTHGVIFDFMKKLDNDETTLEILGDGTQTKAYLHIDDCVKAMLTSFDKTQSQVEIFNVGSRDQIDVRTIAEIVIEERKLKNVKLRCTGGLMVEEGGKEMSKICFWTLGGLKR